MVGTFRFNEDMYQKVLELHEQGKNTVEIQEILGINSTTAGRWLRHGPPRTLKPYKKPVAPTPILPTFPDEDIPVEEIISQLKKANSKRIQHENAKKWFTIKAPVEGPFAIMFFGDPHVDDNYCNWELLSHHINLAKSHDRIYGINIGDTHNNWVGRLMKLYKDQDVTQKTAYRLAEWFMFESGVKWLVWLLGNHDAWNDGIARLKQMGGTAVVMQDWRAQFKIQCYNGKEILIDAAHDHKGHSKFNELHAQDNVALMEKTPHLAIAGHRHHPALKKKWVPAEGMVSWLARLGSYKWVDQHAKNLGFYDYQDAPAMLAIIDPDAPPSQIMHVTDNIELGIDILDLMIKKRSKKTKVRDR